MLERSLPGEIYRHESSSLLDTNWEQCVCSSVTQAGCIRNVEILLCERRRGPVLVHIQSSNCSFNHHISDRLKHSCDTSCPTLLLSRGLLKLVLSVHLLSCYFFSLNKFCLNNCCETAKYE